MNDSCTLFHYNLTCLFASAVMFYFTLLLIPRLALRIIKLTLHFPKHIVCVWRYTAKTFYCKYATFLPSLLHDVVTFCLMFLWHMYTVNVLLHTFLFFVCFFLSVRPNLVQHIYIYFKVSAWTHNAAVFFYFVRVLYLGCCHFLITFSVNNTVL